MTETLLTYNIAKLAKEKGFGSSTTNYYTPNSKKLVYGLHLVSHVSERIPTYPQSLLQKWLRDEHDIDIVVQPYWNEEYEEKMYQVYHSMTEVTFKEYYTYEDALEKGLEEVLNLIPDKLCQELKN